MIFPAHGFIPVRQLVLVDLLGLICGTNPGQRALIAVDGPVGVGKSHLVAELLAIAPHVAGREVIGLGIEGYRHPRARRTALGLSPQTLYEDTYDYEALRATVLEPFRAGREIIPAIIDRRDEAVFPDPLEPSDDAVLLLQGRFLRRPELAGEWDASVLITAPEAVTLARGNTNQGSSERSVIETDPEHPTNARIVGAQRLYDQQARLYPPTWIVDNTVLAQPELIVPDPEMPQWFEQG